MDSLVLQHGGTGYVNQPIVKFSLPDLPDGVIAEATATMNTNGTVTGLDIVDAGSGYTSAPTVTITTGTVQFFSGGAVYSGSAVFAGVTSNGISQRIR